MPNTTSTTTPEWTAALNATLLDTNALGDWLYGELMHTEVQAESVRSLASQLSTRSSIQATPPWSLAELVAVLLTDADAAVVMRARELVRERFLAAHSERVSALVWSQQDREDGPIEAWKRHRDAQDVGCEFDGVAR